MRYELFFVAASCLTRPIAAQTEKGNWLLSGSTALSFSSGKVDASSENATTIFGLTASGGGFVSNGLALGLDIGFLSVTQGAGQESIYQLGPFIRYYLPARIFFQTGYAFGGQQEEGDSFTTGDFHLGAGYMALLNAHAALEPMMVFHFTSAKDNDHSANGFRLDLNIGFTLFIGGEDE